jgi:hypothetical protein
LGLKKVAIKILGTLIMSVILHECEAWRFTLTEEYPGIKNMLLANFKELGCEGVEWIYLALQ